MQTLWKDDEAAACTGELEQRVYSSRLLGQDKTLVLHAILPYPYVDHTHADAIVAIANTADGEARIREIYGDTVVDTGLWTEEVLTARARHYGLSVDEYKKNNVLKTEVTSRDVAELAAELCGTLFAKTTGAQIPVDGGNDRVI